MNQIITHTQGFNWPLFQWLNKHKLFMQVTWWSERELKNDKFKAEGCALYFCPNEFSERPEFWRVSPIFNAGKNLVGEKLVEWLVNEGNRNEIQVCVQQIKQCCK